MNMKYTFYFTTEIFCNYDIEADSIEQAQAKAIELLQHPTYDFTDAMEQLIIVHAEVANVIGFKGKAEDENEKTYVFPPVEFDANGFRTK
jgi:hypothetical protein